jgi:hypothetical protein
VTVEPSRLRLESCRNLHETLVHAFAKAGEQIRHSISQPVQLLAQLSAGEVCSFFGQPAAVTSAR